MRSVQLYSGGLDSVCINYLEKPDMALFVHLGTNVCDVEMDHIMDQPVNPTMVTLDGLSHFELPNKILPARNTYLVLMAANYGEEIILGSTLGDTTRDKDAMWAMQLTGLLRHMMEPGKMPKAVTRPEMYRVLVPYKKNTKGQLVAKYIKEGGSITNLIESYSCYGGMETECGRCRACLRKYVALSYNNISSRHIFRNPVTLSAMEELYKYSTAAGRNVAELTEIKTVMHKHR